MYIEANEFFSLNKPLTEAGYYETDQHRRLYRDLKGLIQTGGIFALTGMVGSGKTTLLHKIQTELKKEGRIIVSRSLATEKNTLTIATIFVALFYDLSQKEKDFKIPTTGEKRERELIILMKKYKKPVALFIDEAHDIHGRTLLRLKRIIEIISSEGCKLSIILAGHPKLGNSLSTASMEEIAARVKIFKIDEAVGNKEKYIGWLLKQCLQEKVKPQDIITAEAIERLASALITPLQIEYYLTKAMHLAYQLGDKPIQKDIIDQVLIPDLNSLSAKLARSGYQFSAVCDLLGATPKEARAFLDGKLTTPRRSEFLQKIHSIDIISEV